MQSSTAFWGSRGGALCRAGCGDQDYQGSNWCINENTYPGLIWLPIPQDSSWPSGMMPRVSAQIAELMGSFVHHARSFTLSTSRFLQNSVQDDIVPCQQQSHVTTWNKAGSARRSGRALEQYIYRLNLSLYHVCDRIFTSLVVLPQITSLSVRSLTAISFKSLALSVGRGERKHGTKQRERQPCKSRNHPHPQVLSFTKLLCRLPC